MTLDAAIGFFRRHRTTLFRAECRIERKGGGEPTFDPNTGQVEGPAPEVIYEGPCNVREMPRSGTDVAVAEQEVRLGRADIWLPHDTPVREDDVLIVTVTKHDADMVDQRWRITDVFLDAWQISRRALGEKVTRGLEGW
jgi:hypothetical protein